MSKHSSIILTLVIGIIVSACSSSTKHDSFSFSDDLVVTQDSSIFIADTTEGENISRNRKLARGYRATFNDKNDLHLTAAQRYGITPIDSLHSADEHFFTSLTRIDSCQYYSIKKLTHSAPYLTPRAKWMLMTIGKNFQDSLASQGIYGYQLIVTSLLRTDESIRSLRRRNSNASDNSAHRYGTTFDISYTKYNRTDTTTYLPDWQVKETFAEVLYDLRELDLCYVKYEVKQGCFHITAR